MKVLVVGVGSIGNRHIDNLFSIGINKISVCDNDRLKLSKIEKEYSDIHVHNDYLAALESNPDVVFICTPPNSHTPILEKAIKMNCHVFCEKPVSNELGDLIRLDSIAKEKGLKIMIGYVMRFMEPIKKIKEILSSGQLGTINYSRTIVSQYLPDWHPWEDYRKFFVSQKDKGGGALLEESHAIDYITWFMGEVKNVNCFNRKIGNLDMDCENISILNLEFNSGAISNIHLDLLGRVLRKETEISCENGTIHWDSERNLLRLYEAGKDDWLEYNLPVGPEVYIDQIEHFFECVYKDKTPLITLGDGIETLRICLAGFKSSDERRLVNLEEINNTTKVQRII